MVHFFFSQRYNILEFHLQSCNKQEQDNSYFNHESNLFLGNLETEDADEQSNDQIGHEWWLSEFLENYC